MLSSWQVAIDVPLNVGGGPALKLASIDSFIGQRRRTVDTYQDIPGIHEQYPEGRDFHRRWLSRDNSSEKLSDTDSVMPERKNNKKNKPPQIARQVFEKVGKVNFYFTSEPLAKAENMEAMK